VDYEQLILVFTSIIWEAMPFIVLGVVIAGILEELVPPRYITRLIPQNRFLAIALGGFLGILFPMCECGIIVVMRRLLRKGVPLSVCTCYMLAGPIINVVVMLSTYMAFAQTATRQEFSGFALLMVALRMGLGFLVAFNTSLIVEWQYRKHGNKLLSARAISDTASANDNGDDEDVPVKTRTLWERLGNVAETALHDFVDVMVFLIFGAFLAALAREWLNQESSQRILEHLQQTPALSILTMMGLAILLCICSEADAFVAASFSNLVPATAKLAFLVLGPMLDFKLYMMYTRVFRTRLIWTIILSVVVQVFAFSLITHYVWESQNPAPAVTSPGR
jgi:uncharacterized membrane protein YraQ (UPF0718 family)